MRTEMTPLASQEPYRNGTPVMPMTPMQSPIYTAPSSPGTQASELSEKELQTKTRRDIMLSATRLGKQNIASWAGKDYDDKDVSVLVKTKASLHACKSVSEARASAWEKAKKANYIDGLRHEEMKRIQEGENHKKAKSEAEKRETEEEVEKVK